MMEKSILMLLRFVTIPVIQSAPNYPAEAIENVADTAHNGVKTVIIDEG